jgi:hydantoinase/carbamoylase family amidase
MYQTKPNINIERLSANFDDLADIGATPEGGVNRLALSHEDLEARSWLAHQFELAHLEVQDDEAGNLSGIWRCQNPDAKTLLLGSHLDTVPNGGRFDGSVGVLGALECVQAIQEAGLDLPFHLEVIDFTDEEGCWQSLFGSRALTGNLKDNYTYGLTDRVAPFRAALFRAGIRPQDISHAKRDPETLLGYLELHIEQSYSLDDTKDDIGVVTAIVGRTTYQITFHGEAAHSGTTRISARRDALFGASHFIIDVYDLVRENFPDGVINCGNITVEPGSFNIIPSVACVTVECRHSNREHLQQMETMIQELAQEIADQHHIKVSIQPSGQMPVAVMSGQMVMAIEQACQNLNVSNRRLHSLAGHDAQSMSSFTPTGMIFIPSVNGISHNPKEFTHWHHVVTGVEVLLETILLLADQSG